MSKSRIIITGFAIILLIGQLFTVNYSDLSWSSNNSASYLGLIAMILLILSQFVSNREEQKTALK